MADRKKKKGLIERVVSGGLFDGVRPAEMEAIHRANEHLTRNPGDWRTAQKIASGQPPLPKVGPIPDELRGYNDLSDADQDAMLKGRSRQRAHPDAIAAMAAQMMPNDPVPPPAAVDPLEAFLAALPALDLAAYTRPYDQAADAAHQSHAAAVPAIGKTYDDLTTALQAGQTDLQGRMAGYQQALSQRTAQAQQQQQQMGTEALAQLQALGGGGSLTAGLEAAAAGRAGDMGAMGAEGGAHLARLGQVYQESSSARQQDAGKARAAALSNAQNNLGALLSQIGLKKADAERQHQADAAQRQMMIARLRMEREEGEQASRDRAMRDFLALTEKAGRMPRDGLVPFDEPEAMAEVQAVIDSIGRDATPLNRRLADQTARAAAEDWAKNGLDPNALRQWLDAYYSDEKTVDHAVLERLARANPTLTQLFQRGRAN